MLAGLVHIEGKAPPPGDITTIPGNLFRINVLLTLLERFREATVSLSERISRRLHPPHYRDRVRVDTAKGRVGLDGVWYDVTVDQAILFKHLAEANGETVSGPTIAKREGMREFKTSRIVEQLCRKHPEMEELIVKQSDKVNSPYRLLLRPIE
jgi:hypothetical protein